MSTENKPPDSPARRHFDTLLRYAGIAVLAYFVVQMLTLNRCSRVARLVGQPAPPAQLQSLAGAELTIGGPRSRPLLLDFWASWCGPCRASMPGLHALEARYRNRVDVITVNVEGNRPAEFVASAAQAMAVTLPVVHDQNQALAAQYHVDSLPTMVLIDRRGHVVWTHIGGFSESDTRAALDAALRD